MSYLLKHIILIFLEFSRNGVNADYLVLVNLVILIMIDALKSQGYGDIVTETVNANTLASFVKEQMALNCDEVPAWLADCVSTYEKVSVGIRKGTKLSPSNLLIFDAFSLAVESRRLQQWNFL